MGKSRMKKFQRTATDEVIKAFDRERAEAHEHQRRLDEQIRAWRERDRPAPPVDRRKP
jgi:hypothetical protein